MKADASFHNDTREIHSDVIPTILKRETLGELCRALSDEMKIIYEYTKEHNGYKFHLFKLSLANFTIPTGILIAIFSAAAKGGGSWSELVNDFSLLFAIAMAGIGIINLVIIKQCLESHVGVVYAFAQVNLLRRSHDKIMYCIIENKFPDICSDLQVQSSAYWKCFGFSRTAPVDNAQLSVRIRDKFFESNAGATILTMYLMSVGTLSVPVFYFMFMSGKFPLSILFVAPSWYLLDRGWRDIKSVRDRMVRDLANFK